MVPLSRVRTLAVLGTAALVAAALAPPGSMALGLNILEEENNNALEAPTNVSWHRIDDETINVTWDAVPGIPSSDDEAGYQVYVTKTLDDEAAHTVPASQTYKHLNVPVGHTDLYQVQVAAFDAGSEGLRSAKTYVLPPGDVWDCGWIFFAPEKVPPWVQFNHGCFLGILDDLPEE